MDAWIAKDDARPRSSSGVGFSSLMGCRRRVFYDLEHAEKINPNVLRLPSLMGTAIHGDVESLRLPGATEVEVEAEGLIGHVDRYNDGTVTDWKTTKLKSLAWIRQHGPSMQQQAQVHTYGLAILQLGEPVVQVRLVYIPRDGTEEDIYVWEAPLDVDLARQALAWLEEIKRAADNDMIPMPEKHASFCVSYCPFYGPGQCEGLENPGADDPESMMDDPWRAGEIREAAESLLSASGAVDGAMERRDAARAALEGVAGRFGPFLISQRRTSSGSYYPVVKRIK